LTAKHKKRVFGNKKEFLEIKKLICEFCSKEYKTKSGLWKHHKRCNKNITINIQNSSLENLVVKLITDNNDIKNTLLKENQELKKKLNDKDNQINDLIPRIGNTTNNTINNNKFNITVFLNEKCKDAMSINEFVKSIEISLKNLITTKTKGLGIGINEIITENMNKLSLYERPIHCTDKKRETLYVKNDTWTKDTYRNSTSGMLKAVQLKQIKNLHKWIEEHPNYLENEDLKHEYTLLINKCTKPLSEHEKKLFKNICDNTYVKDENLIE
tara:strand:+ start:782 stop:1591 length:810 start_codon:yes stop_codon:yes gene_type:complete